MEVYGMRPVNKTAGIVTSQNGVRSDFRLADRESLKVLGERKKFFMDAIIALKEEIGIDRSRERLGAKAKYPPKILRHPKFKQMKSLKESITKLDAEIKAVRDRIKLNGPIETFEESFVNYVRENHSEIYEKARDYALKLKNTPTNTDRE